ncbi:MAG: ABC transporter permease [Tannerellaceae bacterium]|jgi:ABC-2 type transport system permease protein|nr:ABC transporter permease [Tannerellaceae bacterium]
MNVIAVQNKKSRFSHEYNAVLTIVARDVLLALKSPAVLIISLAMPIVMMGMLGGSLAQNMAGGLDFNYGKFMLVGMLVSMLFQFTITGLVSLINDRGTDFTQEMMISPISRYSIVIGKIFGSSFGGILSMIGTLIVGLAMGITLSPWQFLLILALSPLMCLSAGAMAMLLMGFIKNNKTANMVTMVLAMTQIFLSGAIIPITNSHGILLVLNRLMPMTYCLDLARAVVYAGTPEYGSVVLFNPVVNCIAIVALTLVCLVVGTYFFVRSEKNR